ncbi:hypothetical protein F0562_023799 [Nyssa sinensis]|uniref:CCT domain-containing protein n=1 Tax=Nyssa sinensis TaxID=561372 RepID=A0A5J5BLV7_9ASTE|nr:hypothetical protein F0562_023799 [Nyssa sinensis]
MITTKKAANAVGAKKARACDSCLGKQARWYCAADDAFLCQGCDSSVHSANQLASRHERVRLETASYKATIVSGVEEKSPAIWHRGFTRKARTPRYAKPTPVKPPKNEEKITNAFPLVPEIGSEEVSIDDNEEQLLYRVPVFDHFAAELCNVSNEVENIMGDEGTEAAMESELNALLTDKGHDDLDNLPGFLPSDVDLSEFTADVESLLGSGLDEDFGGILGLGLLDCKEEDAIDICIESRRVKVEDEELEAVVASHLDPALDMARETIDWDFDYESPVTGEEEEEEEKVVAAAGSAMMDSESKEEVRRKIFLRLNYTAVIAAWASHGSPWATGSRPEFNPDNCSLDFMGMCSTGVHQPYEGGRGSAGGCDGGREARVSRYREKRRTRLFSKKIRYEVRKLNAEKRPRMKGRFVKTASFAGPAFPYQLINN